MKILDNPPYILWKFGDDILKPKKVMDKKVNWKYNNNKNNNNKNNKNNNKKNNTDEILQKQKNISMIWRCPNNKN